MIDSEISRNPGLDPYRDVMLAVAPKYMTWDAMLPELTKMYTETFSEARVEADGRVLRLAGGPEVAREDCRR